MREKKIDFVLKIKQVCVRTVLNDLPSSKTAIRT